MEVIEDLRGEIDALDDRIIGALEQRQRVVQKIHDVKGECGIAAADPEREKQIKDKIDRDADVARGELHRLYADLFHSARGDREADGG